MIDLDIIAPVDNAIYVYPTGDHRDCPPSRGMTLLDYFAAKAAQGLCSAHDTEGTWTADATVCDDIARNAYKIADALLTVRKGYQE